MGFFSTVGRIAGTYFGGPTGGSIGGAIGGYLDSSSAQSSERAAADRANAWSADMSNTAYQRAMADMRKAGLNPILAGRLGGASTPGVVRENILTPAMMSAEASMMQAHTAQSQMQANVEKIGYEINKILADTGLTFSQQAQVKQLTINAAEQAKQIRAQTTGIQADNEIKEVKAEFLRGLDAKGISRKLGDNLSDLLQLIEGF